MAATKKAATTTSTAPAPAPAASGSDEKTMALLAHILMIVTFWLGPLIIYLVRKNQPGFALDHAREALNFGITLTIAYIVLWIITFATFGLLFFLPFLAWVAALVFGIMACMAVNKGESYRYPVSLRLVKG